jgi:hypothetical protein
MTMPTGFEPGAVNVRRPSPLAQSTYASERDYRSALEAIRRGQVVERRNYYRGDETDADNASCLRELAQDGARTGEKGIARFIHDQRLPEHLRAHSYSIEIEDSVDFLTHRLASDFGVEAKDATVQAIIDRCLDSSPELSGTSDDDEVSVVNVTRESLVAGDCPVRVRFDPALGTAWLDFYPSDAVQLDFTKERSDRPELAMLWETQWVGDSSTESGFRQVIIRREWALDWYQYATPTDTPDTGLTGPITWQCVETWWEERAGGEDVQLGAIPTGLPFVPWGLLRSTRKELRLERGQSVISKRAMRTADRYNALEQHSWLAARHNSHGNVAIIGDAAMLQAGSETVIHKDVADALTFPGGTAVVPILLPTDPAMIEHQRTVLLDVLFGTFGLARVDQSTLQGMGQVTGYALEILNGKTESTFDALRTQFVRDWLALLNTVLDVHAHLSHLDPESLTAADLIVKALAIDPRTVYPTRTIDIRTGTGSVIDVARLRDDYVAGLLPRREVWRKMGYTNDEIQELENDLAAEATMAAQQNRDNLTTIEGSTFTPGVRPLGIVGGTTSNTPVGTPGGTTNNPGDANSRQAR